MNNNTNKSIGLGFDKQPSYAEVNKSWLTSGLSQKEYCIRNDIKYKRFVNWRSSQIKAGRIESLNCVPSNKSKSQKRSPKTIGIDQKNIQSSLDSCRFIPIKTASSANKATALEKDTCASHQTIELQLPHNITLKISL